jgi:peroxiredoxin family protein
MIVKSPAALPVGEVEPTEVQPEVESTLALVLFSGTDDRLSAATVLAAGAPAMGRPVHVFLQYWALDAFRQDRITKDHGFAPEAGAAAAHAHGGEHWSETLRQVKEIGEVEIQACALSMEMFHLQKDDLDPLVDGVEGGAAFMAAANGAVVFI